MRNGNFKRWVFYHIKQMNNFNMDVLPYKMEQFYGSPTMQKVFKSCILAQLFYILRKAIMDILNFYYIDLKYIRNLSRADDNVMSVSLR